jgi:hypothetical protein
LAQLKPKSKNYGARAAYTTAFDFLLISLAVQQQERRL